MINLESTSVAADCEPIHTIPVLVEHDTRSVLGVMSEQKKFKSLLLMRADDLIPREYASASGEAVKTFPLRQKVARFRYSWLQTAFSLQPSAPAISQRERAGPLQGRFVFGPLGCHLMKRPAAKGIHPM
jgi:hypothetical protein